MLNISSSENTLHLIFGIATLAKPKISDFQEALLTCIIWNRVLTETDTGNSLQPPTRPHTHKHTYSMAMSHEY
jgi:hypothetical protein